MKVEADFVSRITSLIERALILMIMYVGTFKTDMIVLICFKCYNVTSYWLIFLASESVHWYWQDHLVRSKKNVQTIDNIAYRYSSYAIWVRVRVMVFNATFNNISVISWRSVLFVGETGVSRENHQLVTSHWQTLSHNVVSRTTRLEWDSNSQL